MMKPLSEKVSHCFKRTILPIRAYCVYFAFFFFPLIGGFPSLLASETMQKTTPSKVLPTLQEALMAETDVWGEAARKQPNGPSYAFFASLLPPLRYCNAAFKHYPIVLSAPAGMRKARYVSNGSAVNALAKLSTWYDHGLTPVTFYVGKAEKPFGEDLTRLTGPRYAKGYLPIVQTRYREGEEEYTQEAFASVQPPFAENNAAVFVQFTLRAGKEGKVVAHVDSDEELHVTDGFVRNAQGRALVWFAKKWRWNAAEKKLEAFLSAKELASLVIFTDSVSMQPSNRPSPLTPTLYDTHRKRCVETWEAILNGGMQLETPERLVNQAWRASVIGILLLFSGDTPYYSAQNIYQSLYEAECGDAVRALLLFGLPRQGRPTQEMLNFRSVAGMGFHDSAFKLQLLAHYFWLTRDAEFVRIHRALWQPLIRLLLESREVETGLLPRENYCGDIHNQVYSLNSNANAWRGVRDIAAVLKEIGEHEEAEKLQREAEAYRKSILDAVEKSERKKVQPPFIPIALFGEEQPPIPITSTTMGAYWNLMAPYVLASGVFGDDSERTRGMLEYIQQRGGLCMGMIRFHQHSGLYANENALDDLYTLRYVLTLLRRDEVERALVSFYGKLAQGLTRNTFIGAEGTGLEPQDALGRPMYLPPNNASSAFFLWMLRYLLIQDWDMDEDGKPDTLRLLFATPRHWLRDGASIHLKHAPTAFGEVSLQVQSRLSRGEVLVEGVVPPHAPQRTFLRLRLPEGWKHVSATLREGNPLPIDAQGTVDISEMRGTFALRYQVARQRKGEK